MRARREIRIRFGGRKLRDTPGDAYLAVQITPVKYQGRMRIGRQFLSLAALIIGEEKEAALIDTLE